MAFITQHTEGGMTKMPRPYLILVNGVLWDRKMTQKFAWKVCNELRAKGLAATVAYQPKNLKEL